MSGPDRFPKGPRVDVVANALRMVPAGAPFVGLDGDQAFGSDSWGPLASLRARCLRLADGPRRFPAALASRIACRRAKGGAGGTGIAALLSYDRGPSGIGTFGDLVLEVDAALVEEDGVPRTVFHGDAVAWPERRRWQDRVHRHLDAATAASTRRVAPRPSVSPRTSIPREAFLRSVGRLLRHLQDGDIYQANLTQQFRCPLRESPESLWRRVREGAPAPRAAFVRAAGCALVSASPETFVDVAPDRCARTVPIKGTRARGADPRSDAARAAELLASEKDRAELLMIVDLERNDLGRVSETGTVAVPELLSLRTYPAIHHLVATVTGRLRPGVGPADWVEAVFPGGSVTGAPKKRAMEILAALEPVPRGWYTGALVWFDDDGWTRSSILIRSVVTRSGVASVGAGGGIVADSDPEAEWVEANHKARPLTRALGFEPEEAH